MDPIEFFTFAGTIAAQEHRGPAAYRSAASRAYYSAYHIALRFLADLSFYCRGDGMSKHQWLQQCLINCGVSEATEAGKLLENLQESRNDADYRLDIAECETRKNAQFCVERADSIKSQIDVCRQPAISQKINDGLIAYRKLTDR
jgi:uncharacterized protein (UPF0332 family)